MMSTKLALHVLSSEYTAARRRRRAHFATEWLPLLLTAVWSQRLLVLRREPRLYNRSWIADILAHDEQRYTAEEFRQDFRLQRRSFAHLCGRLLPHWETTIGAGQPRVPVDVALLIFLYRLGSTVTQRTLARLFGYERGHVGQLTSQMGDVLTKHCSDWIQCPASPEEWKEISQRWSQIPTYLWNIAGIMDGTLIPVIEPQGFPCLQCPGDLRRARTFPRHMHRRPRITERSGRALPVGVLQRACAIAA